MSTRRSERRTRGTAQRTSGRARPADAASAARAPARAAQRASGPTRALSHVAAGRAGPESRMVDVGAKPITRREAEARALVVFPRGALRIVLAGRGPKGPVLEVARTAAVLAAKRTDALVPLCHSLPLDALTVAFTPRGRDTLEIRVRATCTGRTGVEMEALVGASVAALTVYDMAKAIDHGIVIERIELVEKTGGRSGTWRAAPPAAVRKTARGTKGPNGKATR